MSAESASYDKIAQEQLQRCLKEPNEYIEALVKFGSVRGLMIMIYTEYSTSGKITPLEKLPEESQRKIWKQAQEDGKGRLDKANLIQLSKCLYLIDFLLLKWELNQKNNG